MNKPPRQRPPLSGLQRPPALGAAGTRPPTVAAANAGTAGTGTGGGLPARLQQAMALHRAGRLGDAEAAYRRVLAVAPDQPDALHLLGLLAFQSNRAAAALELADRAIAVDRRVARYHNTRGLALGALNRPRDAAEAFRAALKLDPRHGDALLNLGNLRRRQGDPAGAAELYRRVLALKPDLTEALVGLGGALCETGRHAEAIPHLTEAQRLRPTEPALLTLLGNALAALRQPAAAKCFKRALKLRADFVPALAGLGDWYRRGNRPERAVEYLERAAAAEPADSRRQAALADALMAAGRYDEAEACLRPLAVVDPDFLPAHLLLARLLRVLGRFEEAQEWLLRAAALAPDDAETLAALAQQHGAALPADMEARLRAAAARAAAGPVSRPGVTAQFALAQLLDARDEPAAAFAEFARANAAWRGELARAGLVYDRVRQEREIDRLIGVFTADFFGRMAAASVGLRSELPAFVVGMPRSGTTLVEQILASHSQVHAAGELRLVADITLALPAPLGADAPLYPECLAQLPAEALRRAAEDHVDRLALLAQEGGKAGARRVVDKQPLNFLHLGLIATLWPQARIVHCHRDPRDTLLSCFTQFFDTPYGWCWDLDSLAHFHRQYDRLMAHWRQVLPVAMLEVGYETLVADFDGGARGLIDFAGLGWEDSCAEFHRTDRPVATASLYQVRRPVYGSSVGKWRRYEAQLQPLIAALGDDRAHTGKQ